MESTHESDEIDVEVALAELLLKLWVSHFRASLDQNLNSFFEISDVTFVTGLLDRLPSFDFGLVGDMLQVNDAICSCQ